jgi:hypothetical protein
MRVLIERLFEQMMKPRAGLPRAIKQRVALDDLLDRKRSSTGHGMAEVGVAMLKKP